MGQGWMVAMVVELGGWGGVPWRLGRGCGMCRTGRTRSKAGTWGVSPGAQVRGERDPGIAFFTLQGQFGTTAMAPNVAEFIDKIIYFTFSHGGKKFVQKLFCIKWCLAGIKLGAALVKLGTVLVKLGAALDKIRGSTE